MTTMPARSFCRRFALGCLLLLPVLHDAPVCAAEANYRFDAIRAFDEGRYEDVLASLAQGPKQAELQLLAAHSLARLRRHDEALGVLPEPDGDWPQLVREDLADLRVQWAAEAGRCDEVAEGAGQLPERRAARFLARCAFRAKDYPRVKALLQGANDAEGRAMYVQTLFALNETAEALVKGRAFYIDKPAHPAAEKILALLKQADPRFSLSIDEQLRRAEAWISARRPEQALPELAALPKQTDRELEARRLHVTGRALFRMRTRYPDAAKVFAKAARLKGSTEIYDAFHAIRAIARAGNNRLAIRRFKQFAKQYSRSDFAAQALYLAAWLSAREKLPSARKELADFASSRLAARHASLRRKAEWDLGWIAITRRRAAEAEHWLTRYAKNAPSPLERARAAYWLGRAALLKRERKLARSHFHEAIEIEPLGYYALLSVKALQKLGDAPPAAFDPAADPWPRPSIELPPAVRFYRELGMISAASRAARDLVSGLNERERIEMWRRIGDAHGTFRAAARVGRELLARAPTENRWLWEALLPRPYPELVQEQTSHNGISEHLFYGHMQVESRYDPDAVSGADALGLMQLLPSTGQRVAEELNWDVTRHDILRPHVNIALGARYLGGLLTRYHQQTPLAIAAYNAGEDRVDEWLKRSGRIELARWVEEIPINQTRNYVRRVITAWTRYHASSEPEAPWDIPLPQYVRLRTRR